MSKTIRTKELSTLLGVTPQTIRAYASEEKKRIIEAMLCNAPGYPQPVSTGQGNLVPNGEFTYSEGLSFALPPPEV